MSENSRLGGESVGHTKRKRLIETPKSVQSVLVHCVAAWVRHHTRHKGVGTYLTVRSVPRVNPLPRFLSLRPNLDSLAER
jgi:hypothetical protein